MEQLLHFPAAPAAARYRLTVLGPFALTRNGLPLETGGWRRRPLALLRLLAMSPGFRRLREEVIDLLWPDSVPEAGSANLRDLLRLLRKALPEDAPVVLLEQQWVLLNPAHAWEVDLARFEELAEAAGDDIARLEAALALVQGPPLPEERADGWAAPIREQVERRWRRLCLRAIDAHRAQGAVAQALAWAERWLARDAQDEAALRQVLLLLDALGQEQEALRRAQRFADHAARVRGVTVSPETQAAVERIRRGSVRSDGAETAGEEDQTTKAPLSVRLPGTPPIQATSFIGRERETAAVATLLRRDDVHLLTLTGPGGIGKTRLALGVGAVLAQDFDDGIVFIPLASLEDPDHVAGTVASALGLKEAPGVPIAHTVTLHLQSRRLLLLLDNFEHLQPAAPFVAQLLARCPELRILITSTAALQISAEQRFEVPPLPAPASDQLGDVQALARIDAVALFVDRARAVRHTFELTAANAPAVGAICRCLDGLPLAIELAAARIRLFPPHALLQRLANRLEQLTGGSRDRPARHQTLRATIDWSYRLLSPREQLLFARLSVFAGGCGLDAVESICNPDGGLDVQEAIASLIDKSLVRQEGEQEPRFSLLETLRDYAAERLRERGEQHAIRDRHAEHFLLLAETLEPALKGPRQVECLARLDRELDNARGALARLLERDRTEEELRMAVALYWYWFVRGRCGEGRRWLEDGLQQADGVAQGVRAATLWALGGIAVEHGENERAVRLLDDALYHFRELGDDAGSVRSLNRLGVAAWRQGKYERAVALFEEALRLATALGDRRERASALVNLGVVATHHGDYPTARERLEEALALYRTLGDRHGAMHALINLGYDSTLRGSPSEARTMFEEVLETARDLGMKSHIAYALENLGNVCTLLGQLGPAARQLREGLLLGRELNDQHLILYCLSDQTKLEMAQGRPARATRLGGAVERLQQQLGIPMAPAENQGREDVL
jgi:predicted ATPase/DNA-binding SARP family transcriptional activator